MLLRHPEATLTWPPHRYQIWQRFVVLLRRAGLSEESQWKPWELRDVRGDLPHTPAEEALTE